MTDKSIFLGEFLGTALLLLLGNGVCAAVTLTKSKAKGAGWPVVTFGWGFAVLSAAYATQSLSGAHLNPAVTIGIATRTGEWGKVPLYLAAQFLGAFVGAVLCWLAYLGQFRAHNKDDVLGIFATGPEVRNAGQNLITEFLATFVLVFVILGSGQTEGLKLSGAGTLIVALLVVGIGMSLGGPTGYAINPARDLGPRIAHAVLPIPGKGGSDWGYAWIPIVGPLAGGAVAGLLASAVF
ncbi:glycerol uptake facilitator protein [Streptoalloteichus tenebrarius]|uniref:Glycerol uptake facilitator protein n=1 Tax=Streptoalloteichus tenebrarius (strain ATCC 17920 / DSM 40477 / JCM 4838 / CBS 697.72 / NBRC 16177 / NCIMB 11028 / NRRL B-12390 / A12253. 1 / ISP 5477) TaxID=1933 RepID=A0ABT1HSX0_STRSD|nr:MIP/aquaporin family protein [Streptoalloteichus tenebrarius]MCP2258597.1 glycerol uptake facilitator protein [Streptoalloteichus tenebrarius]BFF04031.1 MIP/aquaporin family protein [Streptoalloteichus tenebrarius]